MRNTFKRSTRTGALSNIDINGYNQARLRKNLYRKIEQDKVSKKKEIISLNQRINKLEDLVNSLINN